MITMVKFGQIGSKTDKYYYRVDDAERAEEIVKEIEDSGYVFPEKADFISAVKDWRYKFHRFYLEEDGTISFNGARYDGSYVNSGMELVNDFCKS